MWIECQTAEYGYDEIKISILIDRGKKEYFNERFSEINHNKEKNERVQKAITIAITRELQK